jgi:pyruvate formate lyase activating enzyme
MKTNTEIIIKPKIYGFNRSSEAGPNKFAYSIFLDGCNLNCPYCMNSFLVNGKKIKSGNIEGTNRPKEMDLGIIESEIREQKPEMIMISGGEPLKNMTNLKNVIGWIREIDKDHDIKIGMSTNGVYSERLAKIIKDTCLSYITLDLKTDPIGYKELSANRIDSDMNPFFQVMNSWRIIRENCVPHEIRTTLYPPIINKTTIEFLSRFFYQNERWFLQPFRTTKYMLGMEAPNVTPYTNNEVNELLEIAKMYSLADVKIRHV